MSPPSWPAAIFDAPLLRGLDARGRRELMATGQLRILDEGAEVLRAGEHGDTMFVVGRGQVVVESEGRERLAHPGDTFGEEASIGAAYRATATMRRAGIVAAFPVAMLRRALIRAGAEQFAARLERRLRRRATDDLLRALVPEASERTALLDAAAHRRLERGETLFEAGDAPVHLFLVVDGTVDLREGEALTGHATPGEIVGSAAVGEGRPYRFTARAGGALRVVAFSAAAARPLALRRGGRPDEGPVLFADLHRLRVARSALAIDRDHCVGCGHCAWTCRSLHGVTRLVRRGPVLTATLAEESHPSRLHLVQACQHCTRAPCMDDCPTAAIERRESGEVRIRDALCTGCGACVKACPWDNVRLEARPADAPSPEGAFPLLATKCDLCDGRAGPACVEACPTGAMVRVEPAASVPGIGSGASASIPPRGETGLRFAPAATLLVAAAALAGAPALGWQPHVGAGRAAGWVAALAFLGLGAYGAFKRLRPRRRRRGDPNRATSRVRPALRLHLGLGVVAVGAGLLHAQGGGQSAGTALGWAGGSCVLAGLVAAAAYAWLPPRLARMSERPLLPDDRAAARAALEDAAYAGVSGRSDVFKALFARVLVPYLRQPAGWLGWVLGGRSAADERRRVRARIDRILPRGDRDDLDGLDELIGAVVEARATAAQRWLGGAIRGAWAAHAVLAALALALLAVHLWEVWR